VTALTIILPCYNEAERLPDALATYLAAFPRDPGAVEVLVVDDGSTDATLAVAGAVVAVDARVRVLRAHPNHGKGFAVRTGMLAARGERVVFTDADGSYTPAEVERVAPTWPSGRAAASTSRAARSCAGSPAACSTWPCAWSSGCPTQTPSAA